MTKNNIYPTIAIIIGVILSLLYLIYIWIKKNDKFWDATTNIIVTTLSIVIGAMISIILYNYQKHNDDLETLNELKINLQAEFSDINRVLLSNDIITINNHRFLVTFIEPIVITECAKSGLFESKDVENLLHLSRKVKFYNTQVNYLLSLVANSNNPSFTVTIELCNKNMENSRLAIIQDITKVAEDLGLPLTEHHDQ
jgi:hypothetical protein